MRIVLFLIITVLIIGAVVAEPKPPEVGAEVPEFKLPYATADSINFDGIGSKELLGRRYVIATYPADWSGGCTKEMCTFRDRLEEFESLGVEVLPLSTDLVFSHHEWAKQHKFQFKLLADHTREFGKALGVYLEEHGMFKRAVFVVGPDGKYEYVDFEYSLADNSDYDALKTFLASSHDESDGSK